MAKTAEGVFIWAFANSGQVCINIKRIVVHSSIYEEFCAELARLADAVVMGPGLDDGARMGPIQNARPMRTVRRGHDVDASGMRQMFPLAAGPRP